MNHEDQIKAFLEGERWNCFKSFVDETDRRIQILEKRGYTKDQAIRVLMLYAMQPEEA